MLPEYTPAFWVCAVVAVIFSGIAKAGFGGGVGMVATPLLALTVPVTTAAGLMLPILMACDVFAVRFYRRCFDRRNFKLLLPGAFIGVGTGAIFFDHFIDEQRVLQVGIGILALAFVLVQAMHALLLKALKRRTPSPAEGVFMGALSGFTSTLAHAGGPPVNIFLLAQKLPRDQFVGTTVIFFACLNVIKLGPYCGLGLLRMDILATTIVLSPLCYVGVRLGIFLNRRFTQLWFDRIVYALLFLTGVQLVLGKSLLTAFFD
jgi:uncharacterized membrane protein YfcA